MLANLFNTFIHNPLYNGLIFLLVLLPIDVGTAVILFTIVVKLILLPLSLSAVKTQMQIKRVQPELDELKTKHKDDKQKLAEETMRMYKEKNIKPFSSIILVFIQIPIILGLYFIFLRGGLPTIDPTVLYSFVSIPEHINMTLFGFIDISGKSLVLAILVGVTQFIQTRLSLPKTTAQPGKSLKDDIAHSMNVQMRYVMPIIVGVIAYTLSAVIGLYWTTSNIFTILQEVTLKRKMEKKHNV